jgi:hypothetical protein
MDTIRIFSIRKGFRDEVLKFVNRHQIKFTPRTYRSFPWLTDKPKPEKPRRLNAYKVTYKGLWLGGKAVVLAHTHGEAIELVRKHKNTIAFENIDADIIDFNPNTATVLLNDNGNY